MMLESSRANLFGVIFTLSISVASVFSTHLVADDNDWLTYRISGADMVLVTAIANALESKNLDGPGRLALVSETQQTLKEGFALNDALVVHQYTAIPALTFWMPVDTFRNLQVDSDGNRRSQDSRLSGVIVSAEIGGGGSPQQENPSGTGGLVDSRAIIGAEDLQALGYTGAGQRIAVIDSGIDSDHPDFAGRIVAEACFCFNPDGNCCPNGEASQSGVGSAEDDHGHGTHVAGICAANGKNIGIAPGAEIVAVKTLDRFNGFWSFSDQTAALDWLYSQNLNLSSVNMSLGTFDSFVGVCDESASWMLAAFQAVENLRSQGTEVVVAAGNDSKVDELPVPACLSNTLTIGATNDSDVAASFSNSSPNVDFFAPGVGILSSSIGGGSIAFSGTSMATPHMAGGIALVKQALSNDSTSKEVSDTIATVSPTVTDSHGNSAPRMDLYLAYDEMVASAPPSAPSNVRFDYGDGEIYLSFQIDEDGGSPVTLVTATCSDGANTFTGTDTSSPITVSGLTNDIPYTCTVTATNSVGTSPASAPTDPITPAESVPGLPIWLLYEASKSEVVEPPPSLAVEGTWRVASEAGSLAVGPAPGDGSWWAIDDAGLAERACYFDDLYVFSGSGSFSNVLDDETWLETWQGVAAEQCGAPAAPHDGTADASWSYDEELSTLTIDGFGAYLGLPKVVNEGELGNGVLVPTSVTYLVAFENTNTMNIYIEAGDGVWWQYKLVRD